MGNYTVDKHTSWLASEDERVSMRSGTDSEEDAREPSGKKREMMVTIVMPVAEYVGQELVNYGNYEFTVVPSRDDRIQIKIGDELIVTRVVYIEHRATELLGLESLLRLLNPVVICERI
ncbi:MAG TPA: hypothetical protein VIJ42_04535 [Stellaceae bacterium]